MLAKVYGVYNIKLGDQKPFDIIMMANIVPPQMDVIAMFDIKGSTNNRKATGQLIESIEDCSSSVTYLDQDFDAAL